LSVVAIVALAPGCRSAEPPREEPGALHAADGVEACDAYGAHEASWQYCIYERIRTVERADRAEDLCSRAGSWEGACLEAWVAARLAASGDADTDVLLGLCGEHQDCAFQVLDNRPADDVLVQVQRCQEHAPTFVHDCVGHALDLWLEAGPDEAELARVIAADTGLPDHLAYVVGLSEACRGVGSCEMLTQGHDRCRRALSDIRTKRIYCPVAGTGGTAP